MFTVKQLATLAGVTPRTLHHYDQIGLLKPSHTGENGYRYYGDESVWRLQQILLYRELDLPLDEIKKIMASQSYDVPSALESHREALIKRVGRLERLIKTVDDTIHHLKGNKTMSKKQIFAGFSDEEQEKYAAEAEKMYDPATVRESNRRWKEYGKEKQQQILAESGQIYQDLALTMPKGAASPEAQACVARWRKNMDYFWTPNLDQLVGLAEMYNSDSRFKSNFDAVDENLAEFMLDAVRHYVANQ